MSLSVPSSPHQGQQDSKTKRSHSLGAGQDDYSIFTDLARCLGVYEEFSEGRTAEEWLRHLYGEWRDRIGQSVVPDFDTFWDAEYTTLPVPDPDQIMLADFRADPDGYPLSTPSGKIEIFSEVIDGFDYDDCRGHPVWLEPTEWLDGPSAGRFSLQLIANQPRNKLHSQLDVGVHSRSANIAGREPVRLHPSDAADRGLSAGDIVRIYNDRGSCLARLVVDDAVRSGVAQLSTGAWYDPDPHDPSFCRHGNPNVLTADVGSSRLAQGCTGQLAMVEIELYRLPIPVLAVDAPPSVVLDR